MCSHYFHVSELIQGWVWIPITLSWYDTPKHIYVHTTHTRHACTQSCTYSTSLEVGSMENIDQWCSVLLHISITWGAFANTDVQPCLRPIRWTCLQGWSKHVCLLTALQTTDLESENVKVGRRLRNLLIEWHLFLLRKFRSRKLKPPTPCQNLHLFTSCSNLFFPRAFSFCKNVRRYIFCLKLSMAFASMNPSQHLG